MGNHKGSMDPKHDNNRTDGTVYNELTITWLWIVDTEKKKEKGEMVKQTTTDFAR